MIVDIVRLHQELQTSLPINGVCKNWSGPIDEPNCSYHICDGELIRVTWEALPTTDQKQKASDIITSHSGALTFSEKLRNIQFPVELVAAHNAFIWSQCQVPPKLVPDWAMDTINRAQTLVFQAGS